MEIVNVLSSKYKDTSFFRIGYLFVIQVIKND